MTLDQNPFQPRPHALRTPDKLAFQICGTGEQVTFAQLEARANQGAHYFRRMNLRPGDHIALILENRREFLEICFAADRCGLYYTAISTHLTEPEIQYVLRDCGALLVLVSDRFVDMARSLAVALDDHVQIEIVGEPQPGLASWSETAAVCPQGPIPDEVAGLDMLYSSGTTGRPKGVKWPLSGQPPGAPTMLVDLLTGLFGYNDNTRYLCTAPLYHAAPLRHAMVTLRMGGTVHVMRKFDAADALHLIEAHRITHSQWVPTMFVRLLRLSESERRRHDLSSMQVAIHAAAPCPIHVKRAMIDWWGPILHEYYAGTENNGFTAITTAEWLAHEGSVGRAKLGLIHICDEHGQELPIGAEGEVYFESGHPFAYHNDPGKTASSHNGQGWSTLGDIGRLDAEGYLYLTDRKSFVIISGGVNVYPQETEDALIAHPAVQDAAVIGAPHEEFGEEVLAVIELVPRVQASDGVRAELLAHCRERLSAIKCPRRIEFRSQLPRSPTGKLIKRLLQAEFGA